MTRVLVTGGAGYVGSQVCQVLHSKGYTPVVFDDFSTGWRDAVKQHLLVDASLEDTEALSHAFGLHQPVAVIHLASLSIVADSVKSPSKYWRRNLECAQNLMDACLTFDCRKVIFSSTCAVHGDVEGVISEKSCTNPVNPYGSTKLAIEQMLKDYTDSYGIDRIVFRYFNVAGADPDNEIGEQRTEETHLIPLALESALGRAKGPFCIRGNDWDTRDGTCVRDYVHVRDVAEAHVLGLERLLRGGRSDTYCLGSGRGHSVREVLDTVESVTKTKLPVCVSGRRAGDVASIVGSHAKVSADLGWKPRRDLREMVSSSWEWVTGKPYSK